MSNQERHEHSTEQGGAAGQSLISVVLDLSVVREATLRSAAACTAGDESSELLRTCAEKLRVASYLLHPPLLEELGLSRSLQLYIEGFSQRTGIQVTYGAPAELGKLDTELELTVFRVVQEALVNVHRHAHSRTTGVELLQKRNMIVVAVADQGRGMLGSLYKEGGGIADMRARVQSLQGSFMIDTTSQGTSIMVALPLAKPTA